MSQSYWGDLARAKIATVDAALTKDTTLSERVAAVDHAYPFGERSGWPYKAWLKARRAYLVQFGHVPRNAQPITLPFAGWGRDPATGRPVIP